MNPPGPFQVVAVDHDAARPQLRAVREAVFIREQGVPAGIEIDDLDPRCRHVLARDRHGRPIGTARLAPTAGSGGWRCCPNGAATAWAAPCCTRCCGSRAGRACPG